MRCSRRTGYHGSGTKPSDRSITKVSLLTDEAHSRVWTLQEAALARSNICYCGPDTFDLLNLTRAAAWLIYNYYFVDPQLRLQCSYAADMNDLVDNTYGYHRLHGDKLPGPLYLLDLSQQRLATNPIDKLYGILGMLTDARENQSLDVFPDYMKSLAEAFSDASWCLICEDGDLTILDYVRHRHWDDSDAYEQNQALLRHDPDDQKDRDRHTFPSWVPQLHLTKDMSEDPNFLSLSFDACLGKKSSAPTLNPSGIESCLSFDGLRIGAVVEKCDRMTAASIDCSDSLRSVFARVDDMVERYISTSWNGNANLALATTLIAGVDVHCKPATPATEKAHSTLRNLLARPSCHEVPSSVAHLPPDAPLNLTQAVQYREAMATGCMNRSFFICSTSTLTLGETERMSYAMGLGPHFMREGDIVAVLYGLRFPAILRPVAGGEKWMFLGTCYLHGVMAGEAMRDSKAEYQETVFRIC